MTKTFPSMKVGRRGSEHAVVDNGTAVTIAATESTTLENGQRRKDCYFSKDFESTEKENGRKSVQSLKHGASHFIS